MIGFKQSSFAFKQLTKTLKRYQNLRTLNNFSTEQ